RQTGAAIHADGFTRIELSPGVQLASFAVMPWQSTEGFVPLRLDGYANARAFLGGASVKPGALAVGTVTPIGGVPFFWGAYNAEENDNMDVGKTFSRQANREGHTPPYKPRGIGSPRRAPARIQLRIPNGSYDPLYLIAAAEDQPDHVPLITAMFF